MEETDNHYNRHPDVMDVALELKAALDDFRKTVQEAVDLRRASGTIGQPRYVAEGLRKLPVRIREPAWITSREAFSLLRVSSRTLSRYRNQQFFTYKKVNKAYRYSYIELVEFMKKTSNK